MSVVTRVAFTLQGSMRSTGGYNYLLNLLREVGRHAPGQVAAVLLVGTDATEAEVAPFAALPGCTTVRSAVLDGSRRNALLLRSLLLGRDAAFEALLRAHGIELVFEAATFFGWRARVPALAWIPDFQHHFLPQAFSRAAWWRRELGFRAQVAGGRTLMVSSEDSRAACRRFYPAAASRVQAVRFAVPAPAPMTDAEARAVADRHGLPASYFFMPNQFWQHKNHLLVVRALALLRERGLAPTILATGRQADPRNPGHVPALQAAVRAAGLEAQLPMPGMVPYADLAPLMQASVALLNPSLFEGWSTSIEEARSAGVPMVLSDLDVHREQATGQAVFFDRNSAESLADALASFVPLPAAERLARREAARTDAQARVERFAADFVAAVRRAAAPGAAA